jgi:hypothetical protein
VREPSVLHVGGKLVSRVAAAVDAQPSEPGRLGALRCKKSHKLFLVDTGAVYLVIPFKSDKPANGPAITSTSGTPIPCWGWETVEVHFGGHKFHWRFLLAAVAFLLLLDDFL